MRRRRGEISLFEILRQPEAAPEPPRAEEPQRPKPSGKPGSAGKSAVSPKSPRSAGARKSAAAEILLGDEVRAEREGDSGADPVLGSTTPPPPEPAPRPRIDVGSHPPAAPRRLPDLAEGLSTHEEPGARWWERDLVVRPVVLGIAGVGVLLSWVVLYQLGAGSAEGDVARREQFAGADAPAWDLAVVHGAPGRQPELRNAEGPDGAPPERVPAPATAANALLPVIMVAQKLGKPENAESLMLHIEAYLETGIAHVTPFRGDFAVFVGPFDGPEEAKEGLKRVRGIPKYKGTDFKDAYVHQLEFTPEEQRLLGRE